jgi:hypothetical protein
MLAARVALVDRAPTLTATTDSSLPIFLTAKTVLSGYCSLWDRIDDTSDRDCEALPNAPEVLTSDQTSDPGVLISDWAVSFNEPSIFCADPRIDCNEPLMSPTRPGIGFKAMSMSASAELIVCTQVWLDHPGDSHHWRLPAVTPAASGGG